jgi:hypothetical protein
MWLQLGSDNKTRRPQDPTPSKNCIVMSAPKQQGRNGLLPVAEITAGLQKNPDSPAAKAKSCQMPKQVDNINPHHIPRPMENQRHFDFALRSRKCKTTSQRFGVTENARF